MNAPPPAFAGPISAAEDLTAVVARRLDGCSECDQFTPEEVLAALLANGAIYVEWGGRYHDPTGDVDTWRDTRKEAEAMLAARAKGGWRFRSSLIRRFVLVTGPEEVPDA